MIEELQMILQTIGDLGEYAVWAVVAFFMWKLLTLASVLYVVRFGIEKLHNIILNFITKTPSEKITYIKVKDSLIKTVRGSGSDKACASDLVDAIDVVLGRHTEGFASPREVNRFIDYIKEYKK